jgi:cysteine desulfurase
MSGTTLAAPVYLDHNATTPPLPEAVAEMLDVLQRVWANPSSTHAAGQAAKRVLADARLRVARLLGCLPAELVFTSGATEANHMAVRGALAARPEGGNACCCRRWNTLACCPGAAACRTKACRGGADSRWMRNGRLDLHAARA